MRYTSAIILVVTATCALLALGCGQDQVVCPEAAVAGGVCGPWYPGGGGADAGLDAGEEVEYEVEEGATFPCAVWESARLDDQDSYVSVGAVFLDAKHELTTHRSLVLLVSAQNCKSCTTLIGYIDKRKDEFDESGAFMLGMARRDFNDPSAPDLKIDQTYSTFIHENWPVKRWPVINDAEGYIPADYDADFPWLIIVSLKDMVVRVAANDAFAATAQGVENLLDYLNGPEFE